MAALALVNPALLRQPWVAVEGGWGKSVRPWAVAAFSLMRHPAKPSPPRAETQAVPSNIFLPGTVTCMPDDAYNPPAATIHVL